jgi:NADPH-dependent 2,4-dienoyl-CoA reductase/sulfur reductase-like enzyme
MRIAVIGGLAAGPAAAAEAVRTNPDADVVLYEQDAHISVGACEIPYFIGDWIEEAQQLEVLTPRQFEQTRGGTVRTRHRVTAIRPRDRRLTVEALEFGSVHEERFDRFILAVGARARRLGIEGEDAPNVFSLRGYADAVAMKAYLDAEPVRHAVIVGGGYIGVEVAEALRTRGIRVTILDQGGRVLPNTLSDDLCGPFCDAVRAGGVVVRGEAPTAFATDGYGRVEAVHTDKKEVIGCGLVLVAIGLEPRTELAEAAGVKLGRTGALAVDDGMQTNVANVWACGDCIEVPRVIDGRSVYAPLAPVGRRAARVAARNAATRGRGGRARFAPITLSVGVCAFGMQAARVGLSLGDARDAGFDAVAPSICHWSRTRVYPNSKPIWVRLVVERGSGRLLGGELVGQEGAGLRADVLVPLIREGYTAQRVLDEIDLIYNPLIAPAVDPLLIAASAAAKAAGASRRPS